MTSRQTHDRAQAGQPRAQKTLTQARLGTPGSGAAVGCGSFLIPIPLPVVANVTGMPLQYRSGGLVLPCDNAPGHRF